MRPTIVIAFWNVNTGPRSRLTPRKLDVIGTWLEQSRTDLVFLEEATPVIRYHHRLRTALEIAGLRYIDHVDQEFADFSGPARAKSIMAFGTTRGFWNRPEYQFESIGVRIPVGDIRRRALRVRVHKNGQCLTVIGLHANRPAQVVRWAFRQFKYYQNADKPLLVGGDFNYHLPRALGRGVEITAGQVSPVQPFDFRSRPLPFTQWNYERGYGNSTQITLEQLGLPPNSILRTNLHAGNIIDYVIGRFDPHIQPRPLARQETEIDILRNFDHFPVVYRISWPR